MLRASALRGLQPPAVPLAALFLLLLQPARLAAARTSVPHPSLLCLGVAKSGTSDLWDSIHDLCPRHFNTPVAKELNHLNNPNLLNVLADYHKALNVSGPNKYTLDFSVSYFWSPTAIQNAPKLLPEGTRTIIMLRDPVSMVLSYLNWRKGRESGNGPEDGILLQDFDPNEVLLTELALLVQQTKYKRLMAALSDDDAAQGLDSFFEVSHEVDAAVAVAFGGKEWGNQGQTFTLPGIYLPFLRAWAPFFLRAPGQTLVLLSDAYFADRRSVLLDVVLPFVYGRSPSAGWKVDERMLEVVVARPPETVPRNKAADRRVACALSAFFAPFNCMLANFLRDARSAERGAVRTYPPERLDGGSCQLWPLANIAATCGLDAYTPVVHARLGVSKPRLTASAGGYSEFDRRGGRMVDRRREKGRLS